MLSRTFSARCRRIGTLTAVSLFVLAASTSIAANEPFKPFKLKTLRGEPKTLPDVLGSKATLVVFFFPTCKFCNKAFPALQSLHDTYRVRGFSMVWINAVPKEERLIAAWQAKHGYTVPVLVGASIRTIEKDYNVTMTPTLYLLDGQGRTITTYAGYKAGDEKIIEQAIKLALE